MMAAAAAVFPVKAVEMGGLCQGKMSRSGPDEFEVHVIHLRGMFTDSLIQRLRPGNHSPVRGHRARAVQ